MPGRRKSYTTLSESLRDALADQELSVADLSYEARLSTTNIYNILSEEVTNPTDRVIRAISTVLGWDWYIRVDKSLDHSVGQEGRQLVSFN